MLRTLLSVTTLAIVLASQALAAGAAPSEAQLKRGKLLFTQCQACHQLKPGAPSMLGPNLAGLMGRKAAKELLHIEGWLDRSAEIVARGKDDYLADALLQEAAESRLWRHRPGRKHGVIRSLARSWLRWSRRRSGIACQE